MSEIREVAITSDSSGQIWNTCVWDPNVGTTLMVYKGGVSHPRSLSFIGRDYLISADSNKPILHVWALNRQEQIQLRMVCPGKVSSVAVSPDGSYCVCGVDEKLYVWHVSSGRLMAVISRHFQRINCIKFTDDGSHFVSASEDGSVIIWPLCRVVSMTQDLFRAVSDETEPRYVLSDHSLSVTDIYIGKGGMRARLVSVSLDCTAKIYDLASGLMLLSLVLDIGLTCVSMNMSESRLFLGAIDGKVYQFILKNHPRNLDYHLTESEKQNVFEEHTKSITCLSVSVDGLMLMSGSLDEQVIIWNIPSMQCLRKLQHKGPVTNAFFSIVPTNVFSNDLKSSLVLSSFKRKSDQENEDNFLINILTREKVLDDSKPVNFASDSCMRDYSTACRVKEEVQKVKKCNQELFGFIVTDILNRPDSQTSKSKESNKKICPSVQHKNPKVKILEQKSKRLFKKNK